MDLVSIIMPAYNSEKFIAESIQSVIDQSYKNWELIICDDCSMDKTLEIIQEYAKKDSRIKIIKLNANSGAANARNNAVQIAQGKFIAFLDSDDTWHTDKLTKQISFMKENSYYFTSTDYEKIDSNGKSKSQIIKATKIQNYDSLIKNCPGNSTIIYNTETLGKTIIPNIRKRNDYLMWLQVIKKSNYLYGLNEILSTHRERENSLSSNKTSLIKFYWIVYFKYEKLGFLKSSYYTFYWILKGFNRKIYNLISKL